MLNVSNDINRYNSYIILLESNIQLILNIKTKIFKHIINTKQY